MMVSPSTWASGGCKLPLQMIKEVMPAAVMLPCSEEPLLVSPGAVGILYPFPISLCQSPGASSRPARRLVQLRTEASSAELRVRIISLITRITPRAGCVGIVFDLGLL